MAMSWTHSGEREGGWCQFCSKKRFVSFSSTTWLSDFEEDFEEGMCILESSL